jgi:hypothetical protein
MISHGAPTAVRGSETKARGLSQRRVTAGLMRVEPRMLRPILVRSLVQLNMPPALHSVSEAGLYWRKRECYYGVSSAVSKPHDEPSGTIPEELDVGTVQEDPVNLRGLMKPSFTEVANSTPVIFSSAYESI